MANIKSQIKRNRQNEAARERNKSVRSALKTAVRRFHAAVEAGETDQAKAYAAEAGKKLDKAASKGVIHTNQAATRKSATAKTAASLCPQPHSIDEGPRQCRGPSSCSGTVERRKTNAHVRDVNADAQPPPAAPCARRRRRDRPRRP